MEKKLDDSYIALWTAVEKEVWKDVSVPVKQKRRATKKRLLQMMESGDTRGVDQSILERMVDHTGEPIEPTMTADRLRNQMEARTKMRDQGIKTTGDDFTRRTGRLIEQTFASAKWNEEINNAGVLLEWERLSIGDVARVRGLTESADLNGQTGLVTDLFMQDGADIAQIRMDRRQEVRYIRVENLYKLSDKTYEIIVATPKGKKKHRYPMSQLNASQRVCEVMQEKIASKLGFDSEVSLDKKGKHYSVVLTGMSPASDASSTAYCHVWTQVEKDVWMDQAVPVDRKTATTKRKVLRMIRDGDELPEGVDPDALAQMVSARRSGDPGEPPMTAERLLNISEAKFQMKQAKRRAFLRKATELVKDTIVSDKWSEHFADAYYSATTSGAMTIKVATDRGKKKFLYPVSVLKANEIVCEVFHKILAELNFDVAVNLEKKAKHYIIELKW